MEPRVEIKGRETQGVFIQLHQSVFWFLPLMTTAIFVLAGLRVWLEGYDVVVKIITTVLYVIFAGLFMQVPKWMAKRAYKAKLKYYGGTMPEDLCQFGDEILLQDVDATQRIPYDKIKRIRFLKDCIAITLSDRRTIGLPNREFTKGSMAELKALFREQCPHLKIPE